MNSKHRRGRTSRNRCLPREICQCIGDNVQMIRLLQWMKQNGYVQQQLKPSVFPETGRGLMAQRSFKPGDKIISIPSTLLLTTNTVLRSNIGPVIKKYPSLTPRQLLSIFLIIERYKGVASFWNPYILSLPDSFTTPSYFTQEELTSLPDNLRQKACFQLHTLKEEFQKVKEFSIKLQHLDSNYPKQFTFEMFKWAWFVINTRSVYMHPKWSKWNTSCEVDSYALVPFLDLLNHSAQAEVTAGFNASSQCYEIETLISYKKYNQLFISYGPHGNERLLLEYGFLVPSNLQTTVQFTSELILECIKHHCHHIPTSILEKKVQYLEANSILSDLSCSYEGLSWKLMVAIRLLYTGQTERSNWQKVILGQQLSNVEELQVLEIAKDILAAYLERIIEKIKYLKDSLHRTLLQDLLMDQKEIINNSWRILNEDHQIDN